MADWKQRIRSWGRRIVEKENELARQVERLPRWLLLYRHTEIALLINAIIVGVAAGLFVVLFQTLLKVFEVWFLNLFLAANRAVPGRIVIFPFITAAGGLIVGFLTTRVFRRVHGDGLRSVVSDIHERGGIVHRAHSLKALLCSSVSIASGGGAGKEAPTVLIGASLGSAIGQFFFLKRENIKTLTACGIAGAFSAMFNAPLGGLVFTMEVIVGRMELKSFIPVVISSVMGTAMSRLFFGVSPLLPAKVNADVLLTDYFFLALAGMLSGVVALYYLKMYEVSGRATRSLLQGVPPMFRPAIGGFFVGILAAFLPTMLETTYSPIKGAVNGTVPFLIAAATILFKPVSNSVTLASGGAGGTLAPVMKAGAMFGFLFYTGLSYFIPAGEPVLYALVCAGAVVAGAFQMPLTGAVMMFEVSGSYELILPLMFSAVFSSFIVYRSRASTFNALLSYSEPSARKEGATEGKISSTGASEE